MSTDIFLRQIEELLQLPENSIILDMLLTDIPQWDSLALISVISLAEGEYGVSLDLDQLQGITTLREIYSLLHARG